MTSIETAKSWGYLYLEEVEAMKNVILSLPQNSICINIGAGAGTSGLIFMECPNVGALHTIDITCGVSPLGGLGNERGTFEMSGYGSDPRYHQICGDSTEVGKVWNGGMVDMVFVDGNHSYEHCSSDILAWLPHIKPDGVISIHDYEAHFWPTVTKSVNDLLMQKYQLLSHARTFVAFRIAPIL
jgi:predicted O-methyltransferase YrrM